MRACLVSIKSLCVHIKLMQYTWICLIEWVRLESKKRKHRVWFHAVCTAYSGASARTGHKVNGIGTHSYNDMEHEVTNEVIRIFFSNQFCTIHMGIVHVHVKSSRIVDYSTSSQSVAITYITSACEQASLFV